MKTDVSKECTVEGVRCALIEVNKSLYILEPKFFIPPSWGFTHYRILDILCNKYISFRTELQVMVWKKNRKLKNSGSEYCEWYSVNYATLLADAVIANCFDYRGWSFSSQVLQSVDNLLRKKNHEKRTVNDELSPRKPSFNENLYFQVPVLENESAVPFSATVNLCYTQSCRLASHKQVGEKYFA